MKLVLCREQNIEGSKKLFDFIRRFRFFLILLRAVATLKKKKERNFEGLVKGTFDNHNHKIIIDNVTASRRRAQ